MKKLDVFPKVEDNDLRVKNSLGGIITILSAMFLLYEGYSIFFKIKIGKFEKMQLNESPCRDKMDIFLELYVSNDCSNLHFDLTSQKRTIDIESNLTKKFLQLKDECYISINGSVPDVPASMHIGLGENYINGDGDHAHMWITLNNRNLSHRIKSIRFGKDSIKSNIDGYQMTIPKKATYMIIYSVNLVPYESKAIQGYQALSFVSRKNIDKIRSRGIPAIIFEWQYSPIGISSEEFNHSRFDGICYMFGVFGTFFVFMKGLSRIFNTSSFYTKLEN